MAKNNDYYRDLSEVTQKLAGHETYAKDWNDEQVKSCVVETFYKVSSINELMINLNQQMKVIRTQLFVIILIMLLICFIK